MVEVWKDIKGFKGLYQVSTLGNVKSIKFNKERILSPGLRKDGYLMVTLCKDGKMRRYLIHRLVAEAFIPNPLHLPCVNHKGSKTDNRVEMLEWCTYSYNNTYNDRHLIVAKPVYCVELDKAFSSIIEACEATGIHQGNITQCCKGKRKSAGGYHWRYAD